MTDLKQEIALVRLECEELKRQRILLDRWIAVNVIFGIINAVGAFFAWFVR